MHYNVFIEHVDDKRQYIIALNESQIELLVDAFLSGKQKIRLKGIERNIEKPAKFVIYNITDISMGTTQEDLESNIRKMRFFSRTGKINIETFKSLGINVTDRFTKGQDWASSKGNVASLQRDTSTSNGKIFISHSSKDEALVSKFNDHILVLGLGLKSGIDFVCTSDRGADIKSGLDFKKTIQEELRNSKAVIQIITKNYKESEVCLNEMGAAWIISPVVIPIVAFPFNYDVGFIHASSIQLKLNSSDDLIKLYDDYKGILFSKDINIANLNRHIATFVDYANSYNPSERDKKNKVFFYEEENTLNGELRTDIFGRPWGEKFDDCQEFHRYFYLELDSPINVLTSNMSIEDGNENVSYFNIDKIHVVPLDIKNETYSIHLLSLENKKVQITGKFWGSFTAWHRTQVMMSYKEIREAK